MSAVKAIVCAAAFVLPAASLAGVLEDYTPSAWLARSLPETTPAVDPPAYFGPLDVARQQAFHGQYRRALMTLHDEGLQGDEADRVAAGALAAIGRVDEALARLDGDESPKAARLAAEVLLADRRPAEAIARLAPRVEAAPDDVRARQLLGRAYEAVGDLDAAIGHYEWFVTEPHDYLLTWRSGESVTDDAAELTAVATAVDRWAMLTAAYADRPELHEDVLAMHVRSYDVLDRAWWPGRGEAAAFLVARQNKAEAAEELEAAAAANPRDRRLLALLGELHVDGYDFDNAERVARQLRQSDPDSFDADVLQARTLLKMRQAAEAEPIVDGLLARRPDDLEALGLRAAVLAVLLRDEASAEVLAKVDALDPDNATARHEVGRQLDNLRQYDRAETAWRAAIERAPWWTAPRNGLGLLLMQAGKEAAAREVLDAAFARDPFNAETLNYLRLLDDMRAFERFETEHFVIEYDPDYDAALVPFVAEHLEAVHPQLVARFGQEPAVKTHIQVFPRHDQFSVRVAGNPFVGTVGACTGSVIAMVSPADRRLGNYDWAEVLRHEYAHTITLDATQNRIPHWMTEGLSVTEEPGPMPWRRVPMLAGAVLGEGLFPMERLTWGFIRPREPGDRALAYAQAGWVCQYITETFGDEAVQEMLAGFRAGKTEAAVFEEVLGRTPSAFFAEFEPWARRQIEPWGYDPATTQEYARLVPQAEALVKGRQWAEAVELWEALRRLRPEDRLPAQRLAGLYLRPEVGRRAEGVEMLVALHDREEDDSRYAKLAAKLLWQDGERDRALALMRGAVEVDVYDADAHAQLADWLSEAGDAEAAELHAQTAETIAEMKERRQEASL